MTEWLLLTATLPASPSALRVRTWRALKATGAGTLRDGVYLLPAAAPTAPSLWQIEKAVREAGAEATMLVVSARDDAQEAAFKSLFDRSEQYLELLQSLKQTRAGLKAVDEASLRKALRSLAQQFETIRAGDFFAGKPAQQAGAALDTLRREIERHLSPGEPSARRETVERLSRADFQGRTWATRKRPWVDRLATAWLVTRFIDPRASFVWLANARKCPRGAVGFDFDGATFTHTGDKVTFEVVLHAFGLGDDPALERVGQLVHYIDIGGIPADAAAGVETLVRGLMQQHADDDALLGASLPLFDALYTGLRGEP